MAVDLREQGVQFARHPRIQVVFHGRVIGVMQSDIIVEDAVVVERKATKDIEAWQHVQTLTYL